MMLAYQMARAGIIVRVLEKHADFLRDFRGDTVHPSTMEVLHELGIIDAFLERPHNRLYEGRAEIGGEQATVIDLSHLPVRCPFIAMMPQWEFLDFLVTEARKFPSFSLEMKTEAVDLVIEDGAVRGVRVNTPRGAEIYTSDLVIAADGRGSALRKAAGLIVDEIGTPIDVLWMRVPKGPDAPVMPLGNIVRGRIFVAFDRGDYYQCGFVIAKGTADEIRRAGIEAFREEIVRVAPRLRPTVGEIVSWDQVKLLTVKIDRLRKWFAPGLLCIGDAAHAMSPVGGIGINLAIQDAVAAANILIPAFRRGGPTTADLAAVQKRRQWPTRATQAMQAFAQNQIIRRVLQPGPPILGAPWPMRFLDRHPRLRRVPARFLGLGLRPEHIRSGI